MLEELLDFLRNKKILILGYGKEGQASYEFLRRHFPDKKIYIADKRDISTDPNDQVKKVLKDTDMNLAKLIIGEKYLDDLEKYDLILKTPGLSFKGINVSSFEDKIYTSIDLFLKYYNIVTVGVTGTKGKSTVSTLIYKVLKDANKDVYLLGNIGEPILNQIEKIDLDSIVVIELSSHQLQFMKYTTKFAILINIFPEHLDHYNSYDEYIKCKYNIFSNSKNMKQLFPEFKQTQIYGKETDAMLDEKFEYDEEAICVDIEDENYSSILERLNLKIKGFHNLQNAIFALIIADLMNIDILRAIESVNDFNGLEHRLEYVTKYNNVLYYNDSISTIPETTILGLKALKETNTLILGGLDRGLDYTVLIDFLNEIYETPEYSLENIILLPDTGYVIEEDIRNEYNKIKVEDVKEAVQKAIEITKQGICLLSPAAASYGFYKSFEERGKIFKETIKSYTENKT